MNEKMKATIKFTTSVILLMIAYVPTFNWMYGRWIAKESYYGHGFLIPLVCLYVLWQRKDAIMKSKIKSDFLGLVIAVAGLVVHVLCAALKIYFLSGFSFVFVLYGLVLFFFGKEVTRNCVFPIFFLFAMIPLPLVAIGNLVVRLKLTAMQCSIFILNNIGFPSIRDGSLIRMPNSFIAIGDPCSGLRSVISLLTLGWLFAFSMKVSYFKKSLLLVLSAPIAILSNTLRITTLSIANDLYGQRAISGFFHDFMGFFVFAFAFIALFIVGKALGGSNS